MTKSNPKYICIRQELEAGVYLVRNIIFKKQPTSAVIFAYAGRLFAYVNLCMHMQQPLDCLADSIFDAGGQWLRCSMHGFVRRVSESCLRRTETAGFADYRKRSRPLFHR